MKRAVTLILLLMPFLGIGATFTVTTTAASGPGSLYEAIQSATLNGTATTDYIAFNLPVNQTTISIGSPLILPSNIVIDGTSQPGNAYGKSNAKVRLQAVSCTSGFVIDGQKNIEIYGLWFSDFTASNLSCVSAALSIKNTDHLILGKPGKGNCFSNNSYSIINPWQFGDNTENTNITVQANRFGMDTTIVPDYKASTLAFGATRNLLFGGNNPDEGNRIGNGFVNVGNFYVPLSVTGDTITIKNNAFGFDAFNGPLISTIGMYIAGYKASRSNLNVVISNNKIGKDDQTNKIWITDIKGDIKIHDNYIGSLNTAVTPGDLVSAIYFENCEKKDSISVYNNVINGYENAIEIATTQDVTILNNSIYCNKKGIRYYRLDNVPKVYFHELTGTYLKGSSTPLSKVQIFSTVVCNDFCENGRQLIATVMADNSGMFEYSGILPGQVSATATTPSGTTSEFYGPKFSIADVIVKNPTCGQKNGYIKGVKILQATSFHWEDATGNIIGTDTMINDLGAGQYRLYIKDSLLSCPVFTPFFTLTAIPKPVVDNSAFTITHASCAKSIGMIKLSGNKSANSQNIWQDSLFNTIQTGEDSIQNLAAGLYYFKIRLLEDSTCYTGYGPFRVLDKAGASLITNQAQITASDCNFSNGSIKNITVQNANGSSSYYWEDSTGVIVANSLTLSNQPGGLYRLKYKDESACDTIVTPYFTIGVRGGINIDSSQRIIKAAACSTINGSITNLAVNGANYYEWINTTTAQKVGINKDLISVPSGYYQLNAGNSIGCKDTSSIMFVPQSTFSPLYISAMDQQPPHCDLVNGYVHPKQFSADTLLYTFKWMDSLNNKVISNHTNIPLAGVGSYYLMATDTNGCSAKIYSATLVQTGKPVINYAGMQVQHDTCDLSMGSIKNVVVSGGGAPYTWQWFKDDNPIAFSSAANQITAIKKGSYKVVLKDLYNCAVTGKPVLIADYDKQLALPAADDRLILINTTADIFIKNYQPGSYTLFDSITAAIPVRITSGSHLITPKVLYDKTFYIRYTLGNCVSAQKPVLVKVYDKSLYHLPNAFSPNGDGINDVWKMQVQGSITIKEWLVFNRYGQQVFSSKNAASVWDGTFKNVPVPVGTYYWLITAYDNEGKELKSNGSVLVLR